MGSSHFPGSLDRQYFHLVMQAKLVWQTRPLSFVLTGELAFPLAEITVTV